MSHTSRPESGRPAQRKRRLKTRRVVAVTGIGTAAGSTAVLVAIEPTTGLPVGVAVAVAGLLANLYKEHLHR